jgi:hypothetical protein
MQRRTNFFIEVICSWDALNARFGFNNFNSAEAIKRLRRPGRWTLLFPAPAFAKSYGWQAKLRV